MICNFQSFVGIFLQKIDFKKLKAEQLLSTRHQWN